MLNYTLPSYTFSIQEHKLKLQFTDKIPEHHINGSLSFYLDQIKHHIHQRTNEWNDSKIYTNPYEFIHTNYNGKTSLTKIRPLSRSFYKIIEIHKAFELPLKPKKTLHSLHIAEGPGGFIEGVRYMRNSQQNEKDVYVGMSLISEDTTVPSWNKLRDKYGKDNRIVLEDGPDKNGDLFSLRNLDYMVSKYKNKCQLITADGGFDFSKNYRDQEVNITRLLFVQLFYAIMCQQKDGCFVMKIFDIFTHASIDIVYILTMFYDSVKISKPNTSRYANSEKYLICKNFKFARSDVFFTSFRGVLNSINNNPNKYINRFLSIDYHYYFIKHIENMNSMFGQQQIENINSTFIFMDNIYSYDIIENQKKVIIQRCIKWCIDHNIPYNNLEKSIYIKRNIPNGFFTRKLTTNTNNVNKVANEKSFPTTTI